MVNISPEFFVSIGPCHRGNEICAEAGGGHCLGYLLEILIRAKYTKQRHELLEQANLMLEILRFQMRLAKDLQCLKVESYGFAAKAIDEIGKLVGGWLKSGGKA